MACLQPDDPNRTDSFIDNIEKFSELLPTYKWHKPAYQHQSPWHNNHESTFCEPTGWLQKVSRKLLSKSSPNIDRFSQFFHRHILRKICNKVITEYATTLSYFVSLQYLVKYIFSKSHYNRNKYVCKNLSYKNRFINFLIYVKLCLVLDTLHVFVNIRKRYCRAGWAKKFSSNFFHIFAKYWWIYRFIFHKIVWRRS